MHQYVAQYVKLVEFLGKALGPDYEIALHDLSEGNYSIVAIANGNNSGRQIGAPLTKKALNFVESGIYKTQDWVMNYPGMTPRQERTVSSTMFIKDDAQNLVGMLCINYNTSRCTETVQQILDLCGLPQNFLQAGAPQTPHAQTEAPEIFSNDISDLIASILEQTIQPGTPPERLNQDEKMEIIKRLKECGAFSVKGAVREVAAQLCCSEPTIYRYLKNI